MLLNNLNRLFPIRRLACAVSACVVASCTTPPPPVKEEIGLELLKQPAPEQSPRTSPRPRETGRLIGKRARAMLEHAMRPGVAEQTPAAFETLVSRIIRDVSVVREIEVKETLLVEFLNDDNFEVALKRLEDAHSKEDHTRRFHAMVFAFGIATIDEPPEAAKPKKGHEDSHVLGLYDPETRKLLVRKSGRPRTSAEQKRLRGTIAHEIAHAVQHQTFRMADLSKIEDRDRLMAVRAAYEGDADIVRLLLDLDESPKETLAKYIKSVEEDERQSDDLRTVSAYSNIANSSRWSRSQMRFPYSKGAVFLSRLYLSGGFPLVNESFSRLPLSTEQVLHPQKYIDGERPIEVDTPVLPEGFKLLAKGKQGELGVRDLLWQCLPLKSARDASEGWGGDAYAVGENDAGGIALLWNTVWDTERDASEFANALTEGKDCWQASKTSKYNWSIERPYAVRQQGRVVAVTRGLSKSEEKAALGSLSRVVVVTPRPVPPLGVVKLAALPVATPATTEPVSEEVERGVLNGRRFEHAGLGLAMDFPPAVDAAININTGAARVWMPGEHRARGAMSFLQTHSEEMAAVLRGETSSWSDNAFENMGEVIDLTGMGLTPRVMKDTKLQTRLGEGRVRRWDTLDEELGQIEMVLVPVCRGKITALFVLQWQKGADRAVLDQWMQSVKPLAGWPLAMCDRL